jgi:hypothetical protein
MTAGNQSAVIRECQPYMRVVGLDEGMYPYGIVQRCPEHVPGCRPGQYVTREQWGLVGRCRGLQSCPPTHSLTHYGSLVLLYKP